MRLMYTPLFLLFAACQTNVGTGFLAGATVGLSAGGLGSTNDARMFVIGAAGAVVGGAIGAVLDMQDRKVMEQSSPRTIDRIDCGEPLTLNDVIKLSQSGISDSIILRYMEETHSVYDLTQSQAERLLSSGVSQRVVDYMLSSKH